MSTTSSVGNEEDKNNEALNLVSVKFLKKRNRFLHRTSLYEITNLIVRRGQEFHITMKFNKPFDASKDKFKLLFETGPKPLRSKGTSINVEEVHELKTSDWGWKLLSIKGPEVRIAVMTPADAIVGKYVVKIGAAETKPYFIYILFNAWCKDDAVYMDEETQREEYVLNDKGAIWVGNSSYVRNRGKEWTFGQFEDVALETSLYLLDKSGLQTTKRFDPVIICRKISEMANCADQDNGVLEGNWSNDYGTHTPPTSWVGSVAILEKYIRDKQPVKYGQCWVFSGIVTTLLRALGIPARSITNFDSAHDHDKSMTIDLHFNGDNEPHPWAKRLDDSIWNFHVWNEAYCTRADLPPESKYREAGWQALDATPQETSGGLYRCGPCPVKAIKNGDVEVQYDTPFLFSEVNGDRVKWLVDDKNDISVIDVDRNYVGNYISTKAVGKNNLREDVTLCYKFPEGSKEEEFVLYKVSKHSSRHEILDGVYKPKTVKFEVKTVSSIDIGKAFQIELVYRNTTNIAVTVKAGMELMSTQYTGLVEKQLDSIKSEKCLKAMEGASLCLKVEPETYLKMGAERIFKVNAHGVVKETDQKFMKDSAIEIIKPEIQTQVLTEDIKKNKEVKVRFYFTNPLPITLTNGKLSVEALRMKPREIADLNVKPVPPYKEASVVVTLTPLEEGKRTIDASFKSDQLCGVSGEVEIDVQKSAEPVRPASENEEDDEEDEEEEVTAPDSRSVEEEEKERRERSPNERRLTSAENTEMPFTPREVSDQPSTADINEQDSPLKTVSVDFLKAKNCEKHHTTEYEGDHVILRRGQEFEILLEFDRDFDEEKDIIRLNFETGDAPKPGNQSLIQLPLSSQTKLNTIKWGAIITGKERKRVHVTVMSSASALIGEYTLKVQTGLKESGSTFTNMESKMVLLFNAWCKDDTVFMMDDVRRNEYVLNEDGHLWVGSIPTDHSRPWTFGQFDEVSLKASLYLLKMKNLRGAAMGNPILISRAVTAMINSSDDNGVLIGRWDGNYSDGISPVRWNSSTAILQQYLTTGEPVKYGQCWVFSGVTTTILRALGIPARSVTNFESAHDCDSSHTIDYHFSLDGGEIDIPNDSIWNFHVWNEAYFRRPDLPTGYDGWQVLDATPQELSGGYYCCGPCSVQAVKDGMVHFNYDTGFVLSEVNGDKCYWVCQRDSQNDEWDMHLVHREVSSVGKKISTTGVGTDSRLNLTYNYKYPEGSQKERNAVRLASMHGTRKKEGVCDPPKVNVKCEINDDVMIGQDFTVKFLIVNNTQRDISGKLNISTKVISYINAVVKNLDLKLSQNITVKNRKEEQFEMQIKGVDYYHEMKSNNSLKIFFNFEDLQAGQVLFAGDKVVDFKKPSLESGALKSIKVDEPFDMKIFMTNCLPVRLNNAVISVSLGHRIEKPRSRDIRFKHPIEPNQKAQVKFPVKFEKPGYAWIVATFESDELSDVQGKFKVKASY